MIERHNILDLFGADKNKYHSCIITCYSFDFLFFEQRVLPRLRRAGMVNINVFVDAKMYQQQLLNLEGQYLSSQSYSIIPIQLNGAFHPKILMGIGKSNGFLAIGSGNLTNSGLSSNDEVWGVFHSHKTEGVAAPLFKTAYEYLNKLQAFCFGINKDKWYWLEQNSPWLKELYSSIKDVEIINNNEKLSLISSFNDASIYRNLLKKLPNSPVENITIISPYYNKNGQIITDFVKDLNPKRIDVVVDSRFGTVPYQMPKHKNVHFHDWQHIKIENESESPRLHAKIIQFTYKKQTCILTGSANATKEALGSNKVNTRNAEMSLLISNSEAKNWLDELQINIPSKGEFNLENYHPKLTESTTTQHNSYDLKINHAEVDTGQLIIYIKENDKLITGCAIVIERRDSNTSNYPINNINQNPLIISLNEEDINLGFMIHIINEEEQRITDNVKLHNTQLLQRTNPNVKSTRFMEIINGNELNDTDLITLLEFANFDNTAKINDSRGNKVLTKSNSEEDNRHYDNLSEEEFNRNEEIIQDRKIGSSSDITMLEDFLHHMTFGDINKEDYSDKKERDAEKVQDGGIVEEFDEDRNRDETITYHKLSYTEGKRTRSVIYKTLERIHDAIFKKHNNILLNLINKTPTTLTATSEDLQALLVGTHLIFMKINESFEEERIKIVVKYNTKENLIGFEKSRGLNIERLKSQIGSNDKEVAYSIDANVMDTLNENISTLKGITLVYYDETPSMTIPHRFFQYNPIFFKNKINLISVKGYLINSVSPLLLILANGTEKYNSQELMRFNDFKKRLFYRVMLLVLITKWKNSETELLELFTLNIFYQLLPNISTVDEVLNELETNKSKYVNSESVYLKNEQMLIRLLNSYVNWNNTYKKNKKELIKDLDRQSIGRIIFKSDYGFAKIISIYNGSMNLLTPLGFYNKEVLRYEIKKVRVGLKGIMFSK